MASFNLANILFFCFLIYIKFAHSAPKSVYYSINGNTAIVNENGSRNILRYISNWKSIHCGSGEGKSVNVQYKKEAPNYNCYGGNGSYSYIPKHNDLFSKVRSQVANGTEHVLFETKNTLEMAYSVDYVEQNQNDQVVITHHLNGMIRKFVKRPDGWRETESRYHDSELTADNVEILVEGKADNPGVRIKRDNRFLKYNFENGTKCLLVKYDGKQIMSRHSTDSIDTYPVSVFFSNDGKRTFINFKESADVFEFEDNQWKPIFSGKLVAKSVNVLFKAGCENYRCEVSGKVYTYVAIGNKLFNKVRRHPGGNVAEEVIFQAADSLDMAYKVVYDESDPKNLVVTTHGIDSMIRKITRQSDGSWKKSESNAPGTQVTPIVAENRIESKEAEAEGIPAGPKSADPTVKSTSRKCNLNAGSGPTAKGEAETEEPSPEGFGIHVDRSKIKILLRDPTTDSTLIDCDPSQYTVNSNPSMSTYKFRDGVKCVEVRYDNKVAWRFNPPKQKEYPKSVHFLKDGPIVVEMNDDQFYFSVRKPEGNFECTQMGKFGFKTADVKPMTADSNLTPTFVDGKDYRIINHKFFLEYRFQPGTECEALRIKSEVPWTYVSEIYKEYPSALYVFADRILAVCGVKGFVKEFNPRKLGEFFRPYEVMIPALAGFRFEKKNGYLFYDIDFRAKCVGVNYGDKPVWKYDASKPSAPYPQSVLFSVNGNTAFVYYKDSMDTLRFVDNQWRTIFSGNPERTYLDLSPELPNNACDCKSNRYVHTYTPKGSYLFDSVIRTGGIFFGSEEVIWRGKYSNEFATKVIYDKTDPNNKIITIHQLNGLVKTFKNGSGQWKQCPSDSDTELTPYKVQILT